MPLFDYNERVRGDQVRFGQHHGQGDGKPDLTPGYTTTDDLGDDGDDTLHTMLSNYRLPNCMQANASFPQNGLPEQVDLVFIDFIEPYILLALSFLGQEYSSKDVRNYMGNETLGTVITEWVERNWDHDC
jgi:hypothetical protein